MLIFQVPLPEVQSWGFTNREGVSVKIDAFEGANTPRERDEGAGPTFIAPIMSPATPTTMLLHAEVPTTYHAATTEQLRVPDAPREAAERAISEMAGVLGILGESRWELVSPRPYLMLSAETDQDRDVLKSSRRLILPNPHLAAPFHGRGLAKPLDVATLLGDRPDGILLLGAAIRAGQGIAKLHELFRVLENGFGLAGYKLILPLTAFLKTYPDWDLGYTEAEVRGWVANLRHPATHADFARTTWIAYDSDVERHLYRIEQAAYDVLFNKKFWSSRKPDRLMRWTFAAACDINGHATVTNEALMRTTTPYDHFGTFPLAERYQLQTAALGDGWMAGDWYFSEDDWQRFNSATDGGDEPLAPSAD